MRITPSEVNCFYHLLCVEILQVVTSCKQYRQPEFFSIKTFLKHVAHNTET